MRVRRWPIVMASLVVPFVAAERCIAAIITWTGGSGSNWSTAANWGGTAPAATGDDLVFAGTTTTANTNDLVTGVNSIAFGSGAGAFTLSGTVITGATGATITNNSSSLQTIALPWTSPAGGTSVAGGSAGVRFTGLIANPMTVSSGTVTIAGAASNTFGNTATVNSGGTLVLSNSAGNAISVGLTINSGGAAKLGGTSTDQIHFNTGVTMNGATSTFDLAGKNEEIGKLLGTGGTVKNDGAAAATLTIGGGTNSSDFSNILLANGTGTLAVTTRNVAANTYTFGSANTYTGKTTIGGVANIPLLANGGVTSSIGAASNSNANLAISSTGVLRYTGASTSIDRGFTTSTGAQIEVVNAATNLELTSTSLGAFTKTGAGTITLSGNLASAGAPSVTGGTIVLNAPGNNAFTGAITVGSGGTMKLGAASSGNQIHDNVPLTVNSGGTFDLNGKSEKVQSIAGAGTITNSGVTPGTLTVSGFSNSSTFGGGITGNLALTHSDANSSTTLNGSNTYSGSTSITSDTATFALGTTGSLTFYPTLNGVSNWVNGVAGATANINGTFNFDLTNTDLTSGNVWPIVEVSDLVETFGGTFAVNGFTSIDSVTWQKVSGGATWTFSEATGNLSVVVPEPGTLAICATLLSSALIRRRAST